MKNIGALVALNLSAPKSYGFKAVALMWFTKSGNLSGVGLKRLYSVSIGVPLKISHVNVGQKSFASLTHPSRLIGAEMLTTFRTFSGWRIAHCIAVPAPRL